MRHCLPRLSPARPGLAAVGVLAALLLTAPARGGGGAATMELVQCSLVCVDDGGATLDCAKESVALGQPLLFRFDMPLNVAAVSLSTIRVEEVTTGVVPPVTFTVGPTDPTVLRLEPLLGPVGSGVSWDVNKAYRLLVPGSDTHPGPYLESTTGRPLGQGLECTFRLHRPRPALPIPLAAPPREEWIELVFVETTPGATRVRVVRERVSGTR